RTILVVIGIHSTYQKMRVAQRQDWWERCLELWPDPSRPEPRSIVHAVLIPTYTEPYEILRETVSAVAEANYPTSQEVVSVVTRETDRAGWANVRRLQDEFGAQFHAFLHIKDPLLPAIVVGKSAALAYGGRVLKEGAYRRDLDPR